MHIMYVHIFITFILALQLGDFLNLSEEGVEGVEPPSLITEMHLHLQDLRFEYWYGTEAVMYPTLDVHVHVHA